MVNAGKQEGLEARRLPNARYDPQAKTRYAGQLMGLLSWDFSEYVLARVEAFEREVLLHEQSSKERVSGAIRIGAALKQLPESPLRNRMVLNAERFETGNAFREELRGARRAQVAASNFIALAARRGSQSRSSSSSR